MDLEIITKGWFFSYYLFRNSLSIIFSLIYNLTMPFIIKMCALLRKFIVRSFHFYWQLIFGSMGSAGSFYETNNTYFFKVARLIWHLVSKGRGHMPWEVSSGKILFKAIVYEGDLAPNIGENMLTRSTFP